MPKCGCPDSQPASIVLSPFHLQTQQSSLLGSQRLLLGDESTFLCKLSPNIPRTVRPRQWRACEPPLRLHYDPWMHKTKPITPFRAPPNGQIRSKFCPGCLAWWQSCITRFFFMPVAEPHSAPMELGPALTMCAFLRRIQSLTSSPQPPGVWSASSNFCNFMNSHSVSSQIGPSWLSTSSTSCSLRECWNSALGRHNQRH